MSHTTDELREDSEDEEVYGSRWLRDFERLLFDRSAQAGLAGQAMWGADAGEHEEGHRPGAEYLGVYHDGDWGPGEEELSRLAVEDDERRVPPVSEVSHD